MSPVRGDAATDPRRISLLEWSAVQYLCERLVAAGSGHGMSLLPLAPPPREITRL